MNRKHSLEMRERVYRTLAEATRDNVNEANAFCRWSPTFNQPTGDGRAFG
jgi:hypothetical protein